VCVRCESLAGTDYSLEWLNKKGRRRGSSEAEPTTVAFLRKLIPHIALVKLYILCQSDFLVLSKAELISVLFRRTRFSGAK
jgi:hypothetical protein